MPDERLRREIALLAARMMYERTETEYFTAKRKAARRFGVDHRHRPGDLPSNAEIRELIEVHARLHEGDARQDNLRRMRIDALRLMRVLEAFRPRLIGSVWTGHIRRGSDIDLHVFSDSIGAVENSLEGRGLEYEVERKRIVKFGEVREFTHIHVHDRFETELTIYPTEKIHYTFRSSITGRPIEGGGLAELEALLRDEEPDLDLDQEVERLEDHIDPYELYRFLLLPLESVKQNPEHHPEGDALYHSLQVFELARRERPYDLEFQLAALLHDVGKAIDPRDHVDAGLAALEGAVPERTRWLIEHHMDAQRYRDGTLGQRARRRLARHEDFEDLLLLRDCDDRGRTSGAIVDELPAVLEALRRLEAELEEWE